MLSVLLCTVVLTLSFAGCKAKTEKSQETLREEVRVAFEKLYEAKSSSYEMALEGFAGETKEQRLDLDLTASGISNMVDPKSPEFSMKIEGDVKSGENDKEAIDAELRMNKTNVFAVVNNVPTLGGSVPVEMIKPFYGKWWKMPIPEGTFENMVIPSGDESGLTPEQKQIRELLKKTVLIKDIKEKSGEKVMGDKTTLYEGVLDEEAFKNFTVEVGKINKQPLTEQEIADLDAFLKALDSKVMVYVGSEDKTAKKITFDFVVQEEGKEVVADMVLSISTGKLNEELKIEIPEKAEDFDLTKILGGAPVAP